MEVFSDIQFDRYSRYIHDNFGINFKTAKKELLEAKLKKLLEKNKVSSYEDYFRILTADNSNEIVNEFISEITVNKTDFFRESSHFDYIKNHAGLITQQNSRILKSGEIRVWSSACATGEEAYTLAMVLQESFPQLNKKILATDLDPEVLRKALTGEYSDHIKNDVEMYYLSKYFIKTDSGLSICDSIKRSVTFRQFNLVNEFPFTKGFDIIFCRNVMIYFDLAMQKKLLKKFYNALNPGGLLFLGHTEGITNGKLDYKYVQPAIYMK